MCFNEIKGNAEVKKESWLAEIWNCICIFLILFMESLNIWKEDKGE